MTDEQQPAVSLPRSAFRDYAPALGIALLTVIFFIPWLFQGKIFLAADILNSFLPWAAYAPPGGSAHNPLISDPVNYGYPAAYNRQLKGGGLQEWNPLVMGGVPAVNSTSTGSPGRYYFVKNLYNRIFPPATAIMMLLFTHLLLMGVFMYCYLLEIGAGWRGALFGAVAWMFSGCSMVWFEFEIVLTAGTFIPLLLLVMERFLGPRRYVWACAGSLAFGTYVLIGHLQFLLYIGMLMLFYFPFLAWRLHRRESGLRPLGHLVACFGITCAGAVLIGALELLPMADVIANSSRVGRTFDFRGLFDTLGRVYYRYLVTLIFPDYFGSPVLSMNVIPRLPQQEYMNYNELCLYLGVPTLFALVAAAGAREKHARFWLLLTVLFGSMMVGSFTFYPFFKWFPGLGKVNPTRIIFLFTLAAAVTAGLGIRALDEFTPARRRLFVGGSALLAAGALALGLYSSHPGVIAWFNSEYSVLPQWVYYLQHLTTTRAIGSPVIAKPLAIAGAAFILFAALALLPGRRARTAVFTLILALLAYDLISFGWYYNTTATPQSLYARTPAIEFLQRQTGVFRVVQDAGKGFYVNTLAPFGIEELGGYTNAYPDRANRLLSFIEYGPAALENARFDRWVMFGRHASWRLYDMMNVRYFLTAPGTSVGNPALRLVFRNEIDIYENTRALPRAFVVHRATILKDPGEILRHMGSPAFDPRAEVVLETAPAASLAAPASPGRAEITRYTEDRIEVAADMPADGWLVFSINHYPGWRASSDGKALEILRADCSLMAVPLAAGRHGVVLEYRPVSISRGRILSLLGLALSLAGVGAAIYAGRKPSAERPS